MQFMRATKISNADLMINLFTSKNNIKIQWQCAQQWLFTDIQVVTFLYTVAFHRLALNRRGNILGGIIGIHPFDFETLFCGGFFFILEELPFFSIFFHFFSKISLPKFLPLQQLSTVYAFFPILEFTKQPTYCATTSSKCKCCHKSRFSNIFFSYIFFL